MEEEGKEKTFEVKLLPPTLLLWPLSLESCWQWLPGLLLQEKEMEKQKMLYQQARLHDRGAAEMVLQMISASKGTTPFVNRWTFLE